jgi:GTP-binding protein
VVLAVNKWDAADKEARARMKQELAWKLGFLDFADVHFVSAKEGKGLGPLMRSVDGAHGAAMARLSTPKLTRAMIAAVERQSPPKTGLVRPKLRYAHQGGVNPPRIIIHGNALDRVTESYKRYLEGFFREKFALTGTPMRIEFRTGRNPYVGNRKRGR